MGLALAAGEGAPDGLPEGFPLAGILLGLIEPDGVAVCIIEGEPEGFATIKLFSSSIDTDQIINAEAETKIRGKIIRCLFMVYCPPKRNALSVKLTSTGVYNSCLFGDGMREIPSTLRVRS